jgi:hypothetical protein
MISLRASGHRAAASRLSFGDGRFVLVTRS